MRAKAPKGSSRKVMRIVSSDRPHNAATCPTVECFSKAATTVLPVAVVLLATLISFTTLLSMSIARARSSPGQAIICSP